MHSPLLRASDLPLTGHGKSLASFRHSPVLLWGDPNNV